MPTTTVELRSIAGTGAAVGWAGGHTVVVDRPDGKAGGKGLGFNGAELLGLAIGGCFANDLRYTADEMGVAIDSIALAVTVTLAGEPVLATSATLAVTCTLADGSNPAPLVERAGTTCMVSNSLRQGVPIDIRLAPSDA